MGKTLDLKGEATRIAKAHGLPPNIFLSLVTHEPDWNATIKSPVGAIGLTQLMPKTAASLGVDPRDPIQNLEGGARYLRQQLDTFGTIRLALAAYNAGPGAVRKYGDVPPYAETVRYVNAVLASAKATDSAAPAATRVPVPAAPKTSLFGDATGEAAFNSLGRIAAGERPTKALADLVGSVSTPTPTPDPAPAAPAPKPPSGAPSIPAPSGGWGGSYGVAKGFADIAKQHGLSSTSEKRDRKTTASGTTSDHWVGSEQSYAVDLSNGSQPTPEMDAAAADIAQRLGVRWDGKGPLEITKIVNGYRVQVLYRTHTGGNHFNHIHLGARRVGL